MLSDGGDLSFLDSVRQDVFFPLSVGFVIDLFPVIDFLFAVLSSF